MPLTRIDSAFLDLDAIGGIDFDVNNNIPTFKVDATTHRVGIGHNSPTEKLHVVGKIRIEDDTPSPGLLIRDTDANGDIEIYQYNSGDLQILNNATSRNIVFQTHDGTSVAERFRITHDGKVGIGTDSPTTELEVIGDITVSKQNAFIELKDPDTADANYRLRNQGGSFSIYDATNNQVKIAATAGGVTIYPNLNANNGLDVMGTITGDGNLDIADGIRHYGDTNTSISFPAADTITAETNGTERLRITSDGKVGIGTASPGTQLHVFGSYPTLKIENSATAQYASAAIDLQGPAGDERYTKILHGNSNTGGTETYFQIEQYDSSNSYVKKIAQYDYQYDYWAFSTGATGTEKLRITSDGKLGIKVTSPGCQTGGIHAVHDATEGTPSFTGGEVGIFQRNFNSSQSCEISIVSGTASKSTINFGDKDDVNVGMIEYENSNNAFVFTTNTSEKLRITSDGNVGIGTNNPLGKLHVLGRGLISTDSATQPDQYATLVLGERAAADSIASLEFRYNANDFSSKIDGRNGQFAVWANWNSSGSDRIIVSGTGTTEYIALKPGGTVEVVKAEYDTSNAISHVYFGGTSHLQRIDSSNEGGDIRFARAVDNADHYSIDVYGNSTTNPRLRFVNVTASREDFTLTHEGRVGIGTGSPDSKLTITTTTPNEQVFNVRANFTTNTNRNLSLYAPATDSGTDPFVFQTPNSILFKIDALNALKLHPDGDVGIGLDSPQAKLHVESAATTAGWQIRTDSVGLSNESGFYRDASDHYEMVLRNGLGGLSYIKNDGGASTANLRFNVQGGERLTILSNGNVGIGTVTPSRELHVEGKAYFYRGIEVTSLTSNQLQSRSPINSGFYNVSSTTAADGWPVQPGWAHLLANTHSNSVNYYSQQFASSFFDQELYFRNTNAGGTTTSQSWGQVMHTNSTLKPVYAESDGSTDAYSRYFYPGGEYYVSVHSGTSNDFNEFKEQGYYHVNNTASNAPASGYGYLEIHRHQGSNYFTQKFTLSGDTSRTFFRRGSDSNGSQIFGSWNTYGSLERENTFTNHQNISGNYHLTIGPNSSYSRSLRIGGDGWQGGTNIASVAVTDGNLHLDAADAGHGVYLNWYGGTSGTYFGDGSSGQAARMYNSGVLLLGSKNTAQLQVHGNANQLLLKPDSGSQETVIHRNDGSNYYILLTAAGAGVSNTWNTLRPFYINLTSGKLHSNNGQEFAGGTKVYNSMNLANIELDFTTNNNKYIDFYSNTSQTAHLRLVNGTSFHHAVTMTRGGKTGIWFNGAEKLYTTSSGAYVNGSLGQSSDANLKENIITVPNALEKVKAMRGVKFNWREDGRADYGVIAQEAETVVPELVAESETKKLTQAGSLKKRPDESDYVTETQKGFSYTSMVGILIEAIKEQQATIDSLTARIDALENP